jgi:hypothetical protein
MNKACRIVQLIAAPARVHIVERQRDAVCGYAEGPIMKAQRTIGEPPMGRIRTNGRIGFIRLRNIMAKTRMARQSRQPTRKGVRSMSRVAPLSLFAMGLLFLDPSSATTVRAKYSIRYLGLPVGNLDTVKTFGISTYETGLDARVVGIATILSDFRMTMKSHGVIRKNVVQPTNFVAEEVNSGISQSMQLVLVGGSVRSTEISPPIKDLDQRVPLVDENKRNVVDPVSSLILPLASGQDPFGPSACDRTFHIFDGFARSDIALEFVGTEDVNTDGYTGKVSVCSVRYFPIAGYRQAAAMTKFMQRNAHMEIRLAPIPGLQQLFIVSATIPLPVGTASLQVEQLSIDPAEVAAPR